MVDSSRCSITRPYADHLIRGTPPPNDDDEEGWRWAREKRGLDERIERAVETLLANRHRNNNNNSNSDNNNDTGGKKGRAVVFVKHIAKFSSVFDFETDSELKPLPSTDSDSSQSKTSPCNNNSNNSNNRNSNEKEVAITHRHVLLIRDPLSVLTSWTTKSSHVHNGNTHSEEVGTVALLDIYSKIADRCNKDTTKDTTNDTTTDTTTNEEEEDGEVVVVDSDELASRPRKTLRELCEALRIDYRDDMLRWEKGGPHECDGPWAKWWYGDVWESEGWDNADDAATTTADNGDGVGDDDATTAVRKESKNNNIGGVNHPRTRRYKTVPPHVLPLLRMSHPAYEFLKTRTLSYKNRNVAVPPSGKLFEDPRNQDVLVYVGGSGGVGRIVPREMAGVSPFDSSVQGGDGELFCCRMFVLCSLTQ